LQNIELKIKNQL